MSASAISAYEALMQSSTFNDRPELARALGVMEACAKDCRRVLGAYEVGEDEASRLVKDFWTLTAKTYDVCESPIECAALSALVFADWRPFLSIPAHIYVQGNDFPTGDIVVCPQFPFGPYRLDFLIMGRLDNGPQKWLCVECDGDEFHNATMVEYRRDRRRDAFLRIFGIETFRFTGSEIWTDPTGCVDELTATMRDWRGAHG